MKANMFGTLLHIDKKYMAFRASLKLGEFKLMFGL